MTENLTDNDTTPADEPYVPYVSNDFKDGVWASPGGTFTVTEVSPHTRPDLFFMPRTVNPEYEVDGETIVEPPRVVHDLESDEIDPSSFVESAGSIRVLAKRVDGGIAYFAFRSDRIQIWYRRVIDEKIRPDGETAEEYVDYALDEFSDPKLVAEAQLVGLVFQGGTWKSYDFAFDEANVSKISHGVYRAVMTQGNSVFGMQWAWNKGDAKQTFYLDVPDKLVKIRWQVRVMNKMLAAADKRGLHFSVADYTGETNYNSQVDPQEGWSQHWWTFEPSGKLCPAVDGRTPLQRFRDGAGLVVDPLLDIDETASTITVKGPEDTIAFAISTADARVIDCNEVRIWIQETNIDWFIYPALMYRVGTGSTTGMSGNYWSQQTIETGWSWYPLGSYYGNSTDAVTPRLQDQTLLGDGILTGTAVDDLYYSKGSAGWGGDGALHIDPDSNGEAGLEWDFDRHAAKVVIHDGEIRSGSPSDPTEHLLDWFEFDDTWISATVTAKKGNNAVLRFTSDLSYKDCSVVATSGYWRGGSFDLGGSTQVDLNDTPYGNSFFQKGTVIMTFTPQWNLSSGTQILFHLYISTNDHLTMRWAGSSYPYLSPWFRWGGTNYYLENPNDTDLQRLQRPTTIMVSWDKSRNFACFSVNGRVVDVRSDMTATPSSSNPSGFTIGSQLSGGNPADLIIHEFKTYDECIVPFGTPFVDAGLSYAKPHDSILSYVRGDETNGDDLKVGSGTISISGATPSSDGILVDANGETVGIQTSGNIDLSAGQITFWWKSSTTSPMAQPTKWICASTSDGYFQLYRGSTILTNMLFDIGGNGSTFTVPNLYDQQWHFFVLKWIASINWRCVIIDGITYLDSTSVSFSAPSFTNLGIGNRLSDGLRPCEGTIKDFCITNNVNTPPNWSVGVEPRLLPQLQFTDYASAFVGFSNTGGTPNSPQGSITYYGVNSDRVYTRNHTMTEDGEVSSINIYLFSNACSWQNAWLVVYKNNVLVAQSDPLGTISATGWQGYIRVKAVTGKTLSFQSGDELNFGICWDNDASGTTNLGQDNGVGASENHTEYYNGSTFEAPPAGPLSWTASSVEGLMIILKYRKPA